MVVSHENYISNAGAHYNKTLTYLISKNVYTIYSTLHHQRLTKVIKVHVSVFNQIF